MLPPCLGRREVLAQVRSDLVTHRVAALVGSPGVGKTLIARHAVWGAGTSVWVPVTPAGVTQIVADAIAILAPDTAPGDSELMTLKRALDEGEGVLVLDGMDETSPLEIAEFVDELHAMTTSARILVTSTSPIASQVASTLRVDPLPLPGPDALLDGPAVDLFVSKLIGAGGDLDLQRHDAGVRRLLQASAGLPLLIEQFAVQAALAGIDAVTPADSLSGAVAASYALVDETSQRALRRMAVLDVAVGVDVVAHMIGQPRAVAIGVIARLERHGLVTLHEDERVSMLATVRSFAREQAREQVQEQSREQAPDGVDAEASALALIRWADETLPAGDSDGSSDEPWLGQLEVIHAAVAAACARPDSLDLGYHLANRAFSALYVAMRPEDALALFELPLGAGPGPVKTWCQVARRAGICASEVRGTFEGLRFLDLAEEPARRADDGGVQLARTLSIRAEIHLDGGQLDKAREQATSILNSDVADSYVRRQAARTLMDVAVSQGCLAEGESIAPRIIEGPPPEERWLAIAARILIGYLAWEQGRELEAIAIARGARAEALALAEDRIALLADILHRRLTGAAAALTPQPESLPWAIRLGYQLQGARETLAAGDPVRAAGLAADVVMLADSARLERDGVEARIVLGDALLGAGDEAQARSSYAAAVRRAAACPMPLRVADALDGLAVTLADSARPRAERFAGAAVALRAHAGAARRPRPGFDESRIPAPRSPGDWVASGVMTAKGVSEAGRLEDGSLGEDGPAGLAATLTKAQFAVAELVAKGLSSKEIAERLYLSPRTVDNHLAQIFRRLDVSSRAKLAALMADHA